MKLETVIRPLLKTDSPLFTEAVDLLNRTQGRGIFEHDYLDRLTEDANALVLGAFLESKLVGVGVAQLITNFDYYLQFNSEIANELAAKKVAQFSTLAVSEALQGQGIGQQISAQRLKWVESQNCDVVVGVSWVSGLKHTSDRVFEKMGFKAQKRVDGFYKKWSIKKPFDCPACHVLPCACSAIFYRRDY